MNKQQAIEIIEREPVGGAKFYDTKNDRFYSRFGEWYRFNGDEWVMHELLEIALGED